MREEEAPVSKTMRARRFLAPLMASTRAVFKKAIVGGATVTFLSVVRSERVGDAPRQFTAGVLLLSYSSRCNSE